MTITPNILLIGSGRLATHLQHWNSLLATPNKLLTWDRHQDPHLLKNHLKNVNLIWLSITDGSIIPFYEKHLLGLDIPVVHFSGALHDSRLICAHPMMSFPKALLSTNAYGKVHFALTGALTLNEALPGFENLFFLVRPEDKPLYHALCVASGNFPQLLWNETLKQLRLMDIPDEAFENYIKQVTENFLLLKEASLTGPLIRNDQKTINDNIHALQKDLRLQNLYEAFLKEFRG